MADVARPRVSLELRRAAAGEASGVRVEAAADALAAVADDAVALDVAAHAGVEVPVRLERVMAGAARRIAPLALRGVEAARVLHRAAHRDADALVAAEAEALLAVAARALLRREARPRRRAC